MLHIQPCKFYLFGHAVTCVACDSIISNKLNNTTRYAGVADTVQGRTGKSDKDSAYIYCFCKQWYIFKDMQVSTYSILQIYNLMSLETNNCIQQDQ